MIICFFIFLIKLDARKIYDDFSVFLPSLPLQSDQKAKRLKYPDHFDVGLPVR